MRGYDSTMPTFTVTRGGALVALGGTPGGHRQVQTNVQVVLRAAFRDDPG